MAKRGRELPARKQRDRSREDESLLIRSAESLGRMIGSLQRQLDGAGKRISETADDVMGNLPDMPFSGGKGASQRSGTAKRKKKNTSGTKKTAARKRPARKSAARARTSGATKARRSRKTTKKR